MLFLVMSRVLGRGQLFAALVFSHRVLEHFVEVWLALCTRLVLRGGSGSTAQLRDLQLVLSVQVHLLDVISLVGFLPDLGEYHFL
jgi:hypothetical protein